MRATEYAPRGRFTLHERTHGLAEISDKRHTAFKSTKPLSNCTTYGTVLWTRVLGVAFCLSVVPDFRPLWREHAPAAGERVHLPTLAAAGGAAVVVIAALALAATDPEAEDVVLDMFAGV